MSEMVMTKSNGFQVAKLQALLLPVAAISMVFVMIIPVPSVVLDILLAASITASLNELFAGVAIKPARSISSSVSCKSAALCTWRHVRTRASKERYP